ncbi:MAG TPA: FAD-binding oxidoreductase [Candidatus Acidoferrales bacterium]|jgi:glycolate oxidase FAD binding subunit|nr:FAD-binding oxidoreductase [Candidatus Acidoferrales bacterium]
MISARAAEIAGAQNAIVDAAALGVYAIGGNAPAAAIRVESTEQIAEIVKFAVAEKLAIVACGARTKIGMGAPPRQYDLALDLTRLDRLMAYDPGDMTLSVEPGIPLRRIESALAEHGQFLPLVVPFMDRATAGGTVASGVDSPLRQFYGTARDYVLGIEFVAGDGALAKSGGRVVKNVSGYDLHKLMIGALGTLGVITRINFRTFPLPAATRSIVASFDTAARAIELRHAIASSALRPLVLEIVSPRAGELLGASGLQASRGWSVVTSFAGTAKALERSTRELQRMAEQDGAAGFAADNERALGASVGTSEFVPAALASSPGATVFKLSVLPSQMTAILDAAAKAAGAAELPWAAVARGVGVIYFALLPGERNDDTQARVERAANEILAEAAALAGNATIPWSPAEWKSALPIWGPERGDLGPMRALKKVFDPHGVFAPGRFMGGI